MQFLPACYLHHQNEEKTKLCGNHGHYYDGNYFISCHADQYQFGGGETYDSMVEIMGCRLYHCHSLHIDIFSASRTYTK